MSRHVFKCRVFLVSETCRWHVADKTRHVCKWRLGKTRQNKTFPAKGDITNLPLTRKQGLKFNSLARSLEPKSIELATQRVVQIQDANYKKADLPEVVKTCTHLSQNEQNELLEVLCELWIRRPFRWHIGWLEYGAYKLRVEAWCKAVSRQLSQLCQMSVCRFCSCPNGDILCRVGNMTWHVAGHVADTRKCRVGRVSKTTMSAFADMSLHVGNSFELKHKKCIVANVPVRLGWFVLVCCNWYKLGIRVSLLCRNDTQCRPRFGHIDTCWRHVGDIVG